MSDKEINKRIDRFLNHTKDFKEMLKLELPTTESYNVVKGLSNIIFDIVKLKRKINE